MKTLGLGTLILIAASFQACGGGEDTSSTQTQVQTPNIFANAEILNTSSSASNVHLDSVVSDEKYTLANATPGHDYYLKVHSYDTNYHSSGFDRVQVDTYSDDTYLKTSKIYPGFTRVVQLNKVASSDLNFLIKGNKSDQVYTYDYEMFPGFLDGLVQNSVTLEPNDYKEIAYSIDNNKTYSSRLQGINDIEDWYLLEENATAGENYFIDVSIDPSNPSGVTANRMTFAFFDDTNNTLGNFNAYTERSYTHKVTALNNGKLYLKVTSQRYDRTDFDSRIYKYTIKEYRSLSRGTTQSSITFEPNNLKELAYNITLDQNISSRVYGDKALGNNSDYDNGALDLADWFVVKNISNAKTYALTITASSDNPSGITSRNMTFDIYDGQGLLQSETLYTGDTKVLTLNPTMNGDLYIKVTGKYTPYIYKYNLMLQ